MSPQALTTLDRAIRDSRVRDQTYAALRDETAQDEPEGRVALAFSRDNFTESA
ncbi:hypothetical protein VTO73DRAFT_10367 [Trametes versicolor]